MNPIRENTPKILSDNLFPVVGIGASAGGLDAFKQLIRTIPEDSGMAFILVQHLDPMHESILSELLQRVTKIPVLEILDNIRVAPNHIYIIPSNKMLIANDGVLRLSPRGSKSKPHLPIDHFFTSLADIHGSHAIGIVLSGTGVDGTAGLTAIKDRGGITIAQEIATSAYPGMPQNAIDAGAATIILPPGKIVDKLLEMTAASRIGSPDKTEESNGTSREKKSDASLKKILSLIRVRKGVDFTYYKQSTIQRRILRRMAFKEMPNYSEYYNYLQAHKSEQDFLYQDLLIPVTSFFRDPKTFEDLAEKVFPVIVKDKSPTESLRVWIAGCSTGQEAYSFAICLTEYLGKNACALKIQIFASDISEPSIAKARSGIYSKAEVHGISKDRLETYFTKVDGDYHVNKSIRDLCLFANHNFLKDPPFAKVDLISCRNVLIYLQTYLQKKAFSTFHYALNEKRFLILGKSENIGNNSDLFNPSNKDKIFIKKEVPEKSRNPGSVNSQKLTRENREKSVTPGARKETFQKNVDDIILFKYSAVGVIVNDQLDIVQFRGSTRAYLEAPPGKATLNVLKMARGNLSYELRAALREVRTSNEPVIKTGIILDSQYQLISVEVIPLLTTIEPYFFILFHDETPSHITLPSVEPSKDPSRETLKDAKDFRIEHLEKELVRIKSDMRNMNEEQEAANEELQSANEELLSGSEELQSLNEELETTKEEIQSTNEELSIVNHELIDRNEQLTLSRQFAEAVVTTLHEPLLVLNKDLRIVRANQSFYKLFMLIEEQTIGKILFELQDSQWDIPGLRKHLFEIQTGKSAYKEWQVTCNFREFGELHLSFNAQPIQNNNDGHLILLAIDDITIRKKEEERQKTFSEELEKQVMERTLSLQKANLELERSNENLNQFVFITSHDLQEPLRKLQVFVSQLSNGETDVPDNLKSLVKKIANSAGRMSDLIRDVLAFSTISTTESAYVKTDLNSILQNVLTDLDLLISEKQAVVSIGEMPAVRGVPVLITQLFNNLFSNSLRFANKEIITISVSSRLLSANDVRKRPELNQGHSYCEIMVKDSGIGFEQHFSEKIFEIFQRLKTGYPGTGIGLALCKKIVNIHEGRIRAEGKVNEGATFFINLPIYNDKDKITSLENVELIQKDFTSGQ